MEIIKVGFCVAYDWYLLKHALPLVYPTADHIWLSIDKARYSWACQKFEFNEGDFRKMVDHIDTGNKITVYEDNFHIQNLNPMENEVRQRNMMAEKMGKGGWHIQLDCDEYVIDFPGFVTFLKNFRHKKYNFNVCCQLITLFKQVPSGFLYVEPGKKNNIEFIQIATRTPFYEFGRRNGYFNFYTQYIILHQSWARDDGEVLEKLKNWGHKHDFDGNEYFDKWKNVTNDNYNSLRNFHPTDPKQWPLLKLLVASDVRELPASISAVPFKRLSLAVLLFKNSLTFSRVRAFIQRVAKWKFL